MLAKLSILCLLLIVQGYSSTTSNLTVDPNTSFFKDSAGRYIFIHGVNVVYKQFPYYPITDHFDQNSSLSTTDWLNLKSWGFKAIRLFISWEGFQPKQGQYNYTYLQKLKEIVRTGDQYDIGVILDVHHDLYSRKFCGEGFPDWLVNKLTFPAPFKIDLDYDRNGIPTKQSCMKKSFFMYYATYDVMQFSHSFFTNKNGMADKFAQMWAKVVSFFVNQKNVIGYDLINEPSGADAWKNLYSFLGPSVNNNRFLLPFYKKLISAIREIDSDKLVLFQPSVADYFGGFYQNPDISASKSVLSYHTYCPFKNSHAEPSSEKKCSLVDRNYIHSRVQNIEKLKIGGMMTQFGSVPESEKGIAQIKRVIEQAEKHWQSWFYWQFKYNADSTCSSNPPWEHSFYYPNGTRQQKKIKALSHSYAFAICGQPVSEIYTDYSYQLTLKPKTCANKFTEIYLNQDIYFNNNFGILFDPPCPKCELRSLSKGSFQLIVSSQVLYKKFTVKVAARI